MSEEIKDDGLKMTDDSEEKSMVDSQQSIVEPLTTYNLQSTTQMEVHHHPHVEKKSFKEYILEGLMIFIAVSMGFIAENIREGLVHREKEKQQIESFVNALHSDSTQLEFAIKMNDTIIKSQNNFATLRKITKIDNDYIKKFYDYSAIGLTVDVYFKPNEAALQEMKASGIIGALKHRYIADSIFKYQQNTSIIQAQEADCYFLFKEAVLLLNKNVDFNDYTDTTRVSFMLGDQNVFFIHFNNTKDLSVPNDKQTLKNLFSSAGCLAVSNLAYVTLLKDQLEYNKHLTALLKKEYHLEK